MSEAALLMAVEDGVCDQILTGHTDYAQYLSSKIVVYAVYLMMAVLCCGNRQVCVLTCTATIIIICLSTFIIA